MKILQKTGCRRDRKFRKATFENQGISGNRKKEAPLIRLVIYLPTTNYAFITPYNTTFGIRMFLVNIASHFKSKVNYLPCLV